MTPVVTIRLAASAVLALALAGCETTRQPVRSSRVFVPPPVKSEAPVAANLDAPPALQGDPTSTIRYIDMRAELPSVQRRSSLYFTLQDSEQHFAAGKRAIQDNRLAVARREFDLAIEVLLSAPPIDREEDHIRLRTRLDEIADAIYHYDLDNLGAGVPERDPDSELATLPKTEAQVLQEQVLELTFPVNPGLRGRVREQVEITVSELPLEENDAVLSYINYFLTNRGKKVLLSGYARSGRYREMMLRIFEEEGVPAELIYVAQQESRYNPRALSVTRNLGIWQFGKGRGKEYGLVQNTSVDYRRDPEMSTRAAARHLRDLYRHYGDWYLALAAYNCGPGCVDNAIFRSGYADFWELRRLRMLPLQTANYVPVILAITILGKNAAAYGLSSEIVYDPPVEYDVYELPSATHLGLVASLLDRPLSEIKDLNPAVLKNEAPAGYELRVPRGTLGMLLDALSAIPEDKRRVFNGRRA